MRAKISNRFSYKQRTKRPMNGDEPKIGRERERDTYTRTEITGTRKPNKGREKKIGF